MAAHFLSRFPVHCRREAARCKPPFALRPGLSSIAYQNMVAAPSLHVSSRTFRSRAHFVQLASRVDDWKEVSALRVRLPTCLKILKVLALVGSTSLSGTNQSVCLHFQ